MKKIFAFTLLLGLYYTSLAQTVINDPNVQKRSVTGFHAIKVSHGIQLILTQGSSEDVAVSATDGEYRDRIRTIVENGVLKIYYDNDKFWKGWNNRNKEAKAYVSFKSIDRLDLSSGSKGKIIGSLNASDIKMDLSSGAKLEGEIKVTSLSVDLSSGAKAEVSGSAETLSIDASSGAAFEGYGMRSENCNADASSGSKIEITVNKKLDVDATSGGLVRYKGEGGINNISMNSGGSVKRIKN